jgi:hypothetical protein
MRSGWFLLAVLGVLAVAGMACSHDEDAPRSRLLITRIAETDVELETYDFTFLSDVIHAGEDGVYGTSDDLVVEDRVYLTIENQPRSRYLTIDPEGPYGVVVLNEFRVEYDVPGEYIEPIQGGLNLTVPSRSDRTAHITLVTALAKTKPPLSSLALMGGELMGTALITLRGYEETSNQVVEVSGSMQIHWANWGDD